MALVMAAETARVIRVAQMIQEGAPLDAEVSKNIALVNLDERLTGAIDVRAMLAGKAGMFLLIKGGECRSNCFRGILFIRIGGFEDLNPRLVRKGEPRGNPARRHLAVDRCLRLLEGMSRTVMTVGALHEKRPAGRIFHAASSIRPRLASAAVAVFDPWNACAPRVRCAVADLDSGTHMGSMNATGASAPDTHHQNGLNGSISFVVFELRQDAQTGPPFERARVALLAGFGGGGKPVRLQRRRHRLRVSAEHDLDHLARSIHIGLHDTGRAQYHMALDA